MPPPDRSTSLNVKWAFEMVDNTAPFNGSLPAMSVPCGPSEGLPVGMMLVRPNCGELDICQAADAFERNGNRRTM